MSEASKAAPAALQSGRGAPPAKKAPMGKAPPPKAPPKAGGPKCPPLPRGAASREASRDAAAGPKMRPLFWTTVKEVSEDSVWANLVPPAAFDKAQLERQFALSDTRTPMSRRDAPGSRQSSPEPRKRLRVLDDGTSQLLAIAFNKLPEPDRLATMVDSLENFPEGLPSEAVLALHKACTDQRDAIDQIRQLAKSEADRGQLDKPERFLWVLGSVPFCSAKVACGALIVGSSLELPDLRHSAQKVAVCCKDIRYSQLLKKCISTSFAVGNFLNRGTARSTCRGVVLPDSLMKLEELRGVADRDADTAPNSARSSESAAPGSNDGRDQSAPPARGASVLDFVAQALVGEAVMDPSLKDPDELRIAAETLLAKAREAAGVSLEETDANCRQVSAEAKRAHQALAEVPASPNRDVILERVSDICKEAEVAVTLVEAAKEQLEKMHKWSSAKSKVKSEDWFKSWVQVLELLVSALTRAVSKSSKMRRHPCPELSSARLPLSALNTDMQDNQLPAALPAPKRADAAAVAAAVKPCAEPHVAVPAAAPATPAPALASQTVSAKPSWAVQLDDDAKMECIDWAQINKMRQQRQQQQATEIQAPKKPFRIECGDFIDNKENSAY